MESAFLLACSLLPLAEACNQSNQGLIATAHALQAGTAGRKKKATRARPGLHPGETCGPVQDWETDEPGHLDEIERGEIDSSLETLVRIATAFNITLSELVHGIV
jgi:hypothetical protein